MNASLFQGTGRLTRLLFRQNRVKILLWLLSLVGMTWAVAAVYPEIYTTQEDILGFGATMQNPAMTAMLGMPYELEQFNIGTVFASEMLLFTAIAVSVMNILLVSTNTRVDEEEGRLEMIRSLPAGRLSYLTAAVVMIMSINAALFLLMSIGLAVIGAEAMTWEASLLYGAVQAATGLFFAGATMISAQWAETSRGTNGLAFGLLILSYIVRAIGDVESETLSLFSPLGWTVRTNVFVENDWWPVWALLDGFVVLTGIAFYFNHQRDILSGMLPTRKGKTHASNWLKTMPGLVWRLEKNTVLTWGISLFLLSAVVGAILGDFETYFADMDIIQAFLPESANTAEMTEQFIALFMGIISLFTGIPAVSILLKVKKEEKMGRMEHFYSRTVSRNKVLGSYYLVAFCAILVMQFLVGSGLSFTASQAMENSLSFGSFMASAFVYVPAVWVLLGVTTLLVGSFPKGTYLVWLYTAFSFIVLYLGNLFEFPEWVNNLSAFHHIPQVPFEQMEWTPLFVLSGLSIALSILGFTGYNMRDISE